MLQFRLGCLLNIKELLLKQKKKKKKKKKRHKYQAHLKGEFFFPIPSRNLF